ncbi:unnamed protein product [Blepharisma stoltei]|uniref:Uncharacterized protein n=1 Tax=Blepharisma stoltei TaxID=1481888 RepID=A0AAU9J996_9CILI|nr:unnamed protein product [Blepharisma stoltei]
MSFVIAIILFCINIYIMGNTENLFEACTFKPSNGKDCEDSTKKPMPKINRFKDNKVKIFDYTGEFKAARTLEKLKEIIPLYVPMEVRCFRGTFIESKHSYVRVLGVSVTKKKFQIVYIEVYYKSNRFLINLRPEDLSEKELGQDIGNLQLIHLFSEKAVYQQNFKDFIGWLDSIKTNPKQILTPEQKNMGKIVYDFFRNMGSSPTPQTILN